MTYCFFKTSTSPNLVRSLPFTAALNPSRRSGAIYRLIWACLTALAGVAMLDGVEFGFVPSRGKALGSWRFKRLLALRGMRGGSMREGEASFLTIDERVCQ